MLNDKIGPSFDLNVIENIGVIMKNRVEEGSLAIVSRREVFPPFCFKHCKLLRGIIIDIDAFYIFRSCYLSCSHVFPRYFVFSCFIYLIFRPI